MASSVLGKVALNGGWMPLVLGLALMFLMAALGGIFYAGFARKFTFLAKSPISSMAGLVYGFIVWFIFVDVIIPMTGMQQTVDHPLWISAIGIGIFYGVGIVRILSQRFPEPVGARRANDASGLQPSSSRPASSGRSGPRRWVGPSLTPCPDDGTLKLAVVAIDC